ncbi:YbhB/YbcL family Raf kinase inhibitor-like protein [Desertihabitans brevis]|uniref:YbhB/YbcL family Raf kinase inhibitor-like protein n=1 Tax=Desertihabitans brevis TaxID=2268447 RepID=A0A367YWU5_9ACTN|nr:YbhB/YbcL family Raf kinase inhibitor-like protein [Desertihabitans brevis]RCK69989.1 YbhB/YbcL family Raf kinase inhibitor-like protein [Desertihabitans brevis]
MSLERPVAPDPYSLLPATGSFPVSSSSFADGEAMDERHAQTGENVAPDLRWEGVPEGTRSFVVSCFDPDAPTPSGFWHWVLVGVPGDVRSLEPGEVPPGAFSVRNDAGTEGFVGAAPPPGDHPHRYLFAVTALDTDDLGLDASASPAVVHFTMLPHILARGVLTGTYQIPA